MTNEPQFNVTPIYPELIAKRPPNHVQCAKEKFSLPDNWQEVGWERKNFQTQQEYLLIRGGVYTETHKSGPRKGTPNYKKPQAGTYCELSIIDADMEAWILKWEQETGLCSKCKGSGWEWRGWNKKHGDKHRLCPYCNSTGIKPGKVVA